MFFVMGILPFVVFCRILIVAQNRGTVKPKKFLIFSKKVLDMRMILIYNVNVPQNVLAKENLYVNDW